MFDAYEALFYNYDDGRLEDRIQQVNFLRMKQILDALINELMSSSDTVRDEVTVIQTTLDTEAQVRAKPKR